MKPAPFQYHAARSLGEAADLLAKLKNACLFAGGQSLVPMMNMRDVSPDHVIDLNTVPGLTGIDIQANEIRIGAMTRQQALLRSDELAAAAPIFREALNFVGHLQTRNRGTAGGSLAHMDPTAELVGLATLMDARIGLSGQLGSREVAIDDYPLGYMKSCIKPDEILTHVVFTRWPSGHGYDFREFAQRHGASAIVGVGTLLTLDSDGKIGRAAIVLIGVDNAPVRLDDAEALLVGKPPSSALIRTVSALASRRPMLENALASQDYRQHLAAVLVGRSISHAVDKAKEPGFD